MAKLDPFSAQIVTLVRNMSDDAILELVRNQLGVEHGAATLTVAAAVAPTPQKRRRRRAKKTVAAKLVAKPTKKVSRKKRTQPKKRAPSDARQKLLSTVERVIKSSKGLSASEISKRVKLPQTRVAAAVRELKSSKRIFQGGDRRFARYAGDARTAQSASVKARKSAAGPRRK